MVLPFIYKRRTNICLMSQEFNMTLESVEMGEGEGGGSRVSVDKNVSRRPKKRKLIL